MGEGLPEQRSDQNDGSTSKRPRSIGRRIATVGVWAAILYVAAVGLHALIPQVFWPSASQRAQATVPDSCRAGLRHLKAELLTRASERVASGGAADDRQPLQRWLRNWDERYRALAPRCQRPEAEDAHAALGRLRHHIETLMGRFDREHAPLARDIDRQLRKLPSASSSTSSTKETSR